MLQTKQMTDDEEQIHTSSTNLARRNFLSKMLGVTAIGAVAASCTKSFSGKTDEDLAALSNSSNNLAAKSLNMGDHDYAVLNYAYLLEQLEAQFYTIVVAKLYNGFTSEEDARLTEIRNHEIAHREFFKTALGSKAIPQITFDFSMIDFTSRASVLLYAQTFEDLGVGAYNGAGKFITNPDYLTVAGKIVSVEARHAAYLRDLNKPGSFVDATVVNINGLDQAKHPEAVIKAVIPFLPKNLNTVITSQAPW